jgi:DNA-binding beta-propeller fold protein YncE
VALLLGGRPIAQSSPHPYRAVDGWALLPEGLKLGEVPAMAIDQLGERIFAFQRGEPPVIEFDPTGRVVRTWGAGAFVWPHGMRIDKNGFVWITDGRHRDGKGQQVFKYTRDGQRIMTLGTAGVAGDGPHTFNGPTDVAVAPSGEIFVADGHGNSRIVKFTRDGRFIKAWGRKGSGPGEFNVPHTLYFDSRGRLFVGDHANRRIQVFDQDGNFLTQYTGFGSPSGIFIGTDDTLYVVDDSDRKRLFVGSAADGTLRYEIANMTLAEGIAVDRQGNIYLGETVAGKTENGLVTGHTVRKLMRSN